MQSINKRGIILLHIPKTGGTSIEETIIGWVGPERVATHIELLDQDDRKKMDDKRFISGHLFFNEVQQLSFRRNLKLAISVREPYARLASALRMLDRYSLPGNELQYLNMPKFVQKESTILSQVDFERPEELAAYFKSMNAWARLSFDNCQARFLLSAPTVDYDGPLEGSNELIGEVSDYDLQVACANLSSVDFICLTERLDESLARIAPEFNQQITCSVIHANTADSPEWKVARPLDYTNPRIRAIMTPLVNQDLKLYRCAVELFETRKSNGGCSAMSTGRWWHGPARKQSLLQRFFFGRGYLPPEPKLTWGKLKSPERDGHHSAAEWVADETIAIPEGLRAARGPILSGRSAEDTVVATAHERLPVNRR